ncbi:SARP family transcriptional regulator [Acrocarpospora corrugata]|uniref:SARP family transcriptional regulator n=1 Tax=Acrocarpospora corrugata TaxID=35763 RepID=A0A5M3WDH8_9ACTN|nr:AfsR/SARP family transcriptional regulator [Acrocarpospora corrugata]GES06132.1 SARP family transcriptional regulator [Acrocarpospora corrugata]
MPLGARKPQALLAALLMDDNRVVPSDRLVEALWGEDPPGTARAILHTYVSVLRRLFQDFGEEEVIVSHPAGYTVLVPAGSLDRREFERLAAEGRQAAAAERHHEAVETFRAALALWRGPALGGVGDSFLKAEAARLDELRLTISEQLIGAEFALGRHAQVLGELTALVSRHPTHERLRGDLMIALYRVGRQSDALAVYRQGRQALVEELGVEPGPELRAVHEAILKSNAALLGPVSPPKRHSLVPAQMPPATIDFTGRAPETDALTTLLAAGSSMPVCVVSGPGGSGKSSLAVHAAHRVAGHYPDGQLYIELLGTSEAPLAPGEVLGRILRQLGEVPPDSTEDRTAHYRSMLARRRVLVVLDDAATESQVRPLLPGSAGCGVLITSRNRLAALSGAALVELDVLAREEAVELLSRIAGPARIEAEPEAAARIVEQCGHLPLAIRIAGARLAARRRWSVAFLAGRLADERHRLDELAVGDQEVRASIMLSYRMLHERGKRTLRCLGSLGLPDFPVWIAAALIEAGHDEAERMLEQLVDAQLVEVEGVDGVGHVRYRLHELVRLFAGERTEAEEPLEARTAAVTRVLSRWLWLLGQITDAAPSGAISLHVAYPAAAAVDPPVARAVLADPHAWFEAEQDALVKGVELAAALDLDEIAVALASALCGSVFVTDNLFEAWNRTHSAALAVARRVGNARGEATLLAEMGQLRYEQDRFAEAREFFSQALTIFRIAGEIRGEAASLAGLGAACREQGYLPEALHFLSGAEELWLKIGDEAATANVKRLAGTVHLERGDYQASWSDLGEALWLYRKISSRRGEGMTLRSMALYHCARGELESAEDAGNQALKIFREMGHELMEAYCLRTWSKTQIRMGRLGEVRRPLEEVLNTCRELGDRWGEAITLRVLGELDLAEGRLGDAREHIRRSLRIWDELDLPLWRARALRDLGRVHEALSDTGKARTILAEALEIFRSYGSREYEELSEDAR